MSEQEVVSLSALMTPSKTVQIDFPGYEGFRVLVCYLAREELVKLRKKCMITKFNKRTHQPEEELNEDKFLKEYCKAVIRGWSGFKYSYLEDDELPYTTDNAETLMKNSDAFDTWLTSTASELENFTKGK